MVGFVVTTDIKIEADTTNFPKIQTKTDKWFLMRI